MYRFFHEFAPPIIAVIIFLSIFALTVAIACEVAPDYYVYEFVLEDEVVTFEVKCLDEHTDTFYRFTLTNGEQITYFPKEGSTVRITKIKH